MHPLRLSSVLLLAASLSTAVLAIDVPRGSREVRPANPNIDSAAYMRDVQAAMQARETKRLTEDEFIAMLRKPGVMVIDARSASKYEALHVRGAVNLPLPDFTADALARIAPERHATIVIYCNNNFANAPDPMPTKVPAAALNLASYTSLYSYGYRNVYELGPFLDVNTTRIPMVWGEPKPVARR